MKISQTRCASKWRYTLAGMTHDLEESARTAASTAARLVPAVVLFSFHERDGHAAGRRCSVGLVVMQLPSELRHLYACWSLIRKTGEFRSLFEFFNYEQFMKDVAVITDTARGHKLSYAQLGMAIMRNFDAERAPEGFPISQIVNLFKPSSTNSNSDRNDRMKAQKTTDANDIWRVLCVEGMWFQDLFNYDFRRTEMCVIPYGTQEGEISFCAYNTGVGWRQIIENMHKTANLAEWYEEHGRHKVYAAGKPVPLNLDQTFVEPAGDSGCAGRRPAETSSGNVLI